MATEIYTGAYAPAYDELYLRHPYWESKHRFNIAAIGALLPPIGSWLDTCCGQGWHLAQFPDHRRMGIDLSTAQLERARRQNPGVCFIRADVVDYEFPDGRRFDLVTNLWSAYSYLNDEDLIRSLVEKMIGWTAPGGALYVELTDPDALLKPNVFEAETGSRFTPLTQDGTRWEWRDIGGVHQMLSPPPEFFTDLIAPHFSQVDCSVQITGMLQLIARHKTRG